MTTLAAWYRAHGRHDLPWRQTREPWAVLVSEVMLQQTQVSRALAAWPEFMARFPTPQRTAAVPAGEVIAAWGRLGYPRRALRLWEAARVVAATGWPAPDELHRLPGAGAYTAGAVAILAFGADTTAADVNITRVVSRVAGRPLSNAAAAARSPEFAGGLRGRDRFLALMDVGALVCTKRAPRCRECPLTRRCLARGPLPNERARGQGQYEGSFRQRRGQVLALLRAGTQPVGELDAAALASLVEDGLAFVTRSRAHLP